MGKKRETLWDPDHLAFLKKGSDVWNPYRRKKPVVIPKLSGAKLNGARLSRVKLNRARLNGADLCEANLRAAELEAAKLKGATLEGADLTGAELREAELREAELSQANLSRAKLNWAKLERADLRLAKFVGAKLIGADFKSADLTGADFREAELRFANLRRAKLSWAKLEGADLRRAELSRANLREAELTEADLSEADLSGADLRGADLTGTNLREADIRWATLDGALLNGTRFENAFSSGTSFQTQTLSCALGLKEIQHLGPSSIGPATLEECGSRLPNVFLEGIGYKDWEVLAIQLRDPNLRPDQVIDITYRIADMRTNSPIQTNSIFFSYSSKDAPFVEAIEKRFNEDHINSWRDVHEISAGPIEAQLERAINLNGTVLLVLSKSSVNSEWVKYEVRKARKLQAKLEDENAKQMHVLCPVALDDSWKNCAWPPRIREDLEDYHILNCSDWQEPSFDAKYEKLKTNLGIYYFGQNSA